jgi:hypothetical protein
VVFYVPIQYALCVHRHGGGTLYNTDNIFENLVDSKFFAHFNGADERQRFYVEDGAA